jgi:two-component system response regulator YesN
VQQRQIAELLIEKKKTAADFDMIGKRAMLKKYPVDLEKELIAYVQTGEKSKAVSMLNDILSEIFSFSSGNLDIIKAKLFELTATLMRAAVDIGAPLEEMAIFIKMYNKILVEETTFEDLCYLTKEVMESFMLVVYENRTKKQTNQHLVSAINFIKQNFSGDLSLETVANHVYVSSYYLSHLFRDEMDMSFSDYVNKVRMEESKRLLKDNTLKTQEVAELVGFNDSNYFSKAFKKYYGVSPKSVSDLYK